MDPEPVRPEVEGLPDGLDSYQPRTEFGRKLLELRKKIIAAREPLLDWDGVAREVAERRGDRTVDG